MGRSRSGRGSGRRRRRRRGWEGKERGRAGGAVVVGRSWRWLRASRLGHLARSDEAMGSGVEKARRSAASREVLVGDRSRLRSGAPHASRLRDANGCLLQPI